MSKPLTTDHRFIIETGNYHAEQVAKSMTEAVIAAFKRRPPQSPSLLTRARKRPGSWEYISTEAMLKRAGYKVNAR